MVNFPGSLDDDSTLYIAVNNLRTQLTAGINASTLTIPVISTAGFPSTGFITILTGTDITAAEAIKYTSITATEFNASQRGADGTTAAAHDSGDNVDLTILAAHHNDPKDAIIALEEFVGTTGNENFLRAVTGAGEVVVTSGSGEVVISGTPHTPAFSLTIEEEDGSPSVSNVTTIVVSSGTLINNGGGQVTLITGSGIASGGGSVNLDDNLATFIQIYGH